MTDSPRTPPHDIDAEEALLGACLLSAQQIEPCGEVVAAEDFYKPSFGHVWQVITDLWEEGITPDPVAVADSLRRRDQLDPIGPAGLLNLQTSAPATSTAPQKARIVADLAGLRKLLALSGELTEMAYEQKPAGELLDWVTSRAEELDVGGSGVPENFSTVSDFLDRPEEERAEWVVPGQIRERWRIMIVALEGVGKSTILKQVALCAAQGINPFNPTQRIPPIRTLVIDVENPDEAIDEQVNLVNRRLWSVLEKGEYDPSREGLYRNEAGINVRTRRDRAQIEAVLSHFRPQLVVAGPIYKLYEKNPGEHGHEEAVREFQHIIDRWRKRFGFGLVLEHHAPLTKGSRGEREIRPSDSSHWHRWVDFGFGLAELKKEPGVYRLTRWKGDRMEAEWPARAAKGQLWPWEFSFRSSSRGAMPPPEQMF